MHNNYDWIEGMNNCPKERIQELFGMFMLIRIELQTEMEFMLIEE